MAVELMKLTPPEDMMKLLDLKAEFLEKIHQITGISERLMAFPEPGERSVWRENIWFGYGEGDDGGGAALAAFRYGRCPFAKDYYQDQ